MSYTIVVDPILLVTKDIIDLSLKMGGSANNNASLV